MKEFALRLLAGPVLMAVLVLLGGACGYELGLTVSCVVVPIVTIALAIGLARLTDGYTAVFAAIAAILAGLASADGYRNVHELRTGEFAVDVALSDLPKLHDKDQLTLGDGVAWEAMQQVASKTYRSGGGSTRSEQTSYCYAYPIVPKRWTPNDPVTVWRFGAMNHAQGRPLSERVYQFGEPDELCRRAIDMTTRRYHLHTAPDAIYLEALVSESSDETENRFKGVFAMFLLGSLWLGIVAYLRLREWWVDRR